MHNIGDIVTVVDTVNIGEYITFEIAGIRIIESGVATNYISADNVDYSTDVVELVS